MINYNEALKQNVILTKRTKFWITLSVLHKIFHYEDKFCLGWMGITDGKTWEINKLIYSSVLTRGFHDLLPTSEDFLACWVRKALSMPFDQDEVFNLFSSYYHIFLAVLVFLPEAPTTWNTNTMLMIRDKINLEAEEMVQQQQWKNNQTYLWCKDYLPFIQQIRLNCKHWPWTG